MSDNQIVRFVQEGGAVAGRRESDYPYQRLRAESGAEIAEAALGLPPRHDQPPLPPSSTGKIAIKINNHYGDEVLNVYPVSSS